MATAVRAESRSAPLAIAPAWHTAALIAFLILMSAAGGTMRRGAHVSNLPLLYISLMAGEWGLVYYVWRGLRRTSVDLLPFIGGRWTAPAVLGDALLGAGVWLLWKGAAFCFSPWLSTDAAPAISRLMPHGVAESSLWVLLSISAGISEEIVFRGYLQRQLTGWTGRGSIALLFQSTMFGIAHAYQGWRACLVIAAYGALFTMLALWRKSLRPGMIAHAWTDVVAGLLS
jgi:membrane protease YdiL (CAAX protease family)